MKKPNPSHYFGSPHMTQAEVQEFMDNMLREELGQQAEQIIMFTRVLQKVFAATEAAKTTPTE
jgi:hypothetical protein